jgi:hypothetical protein
MEPGMNPLVYLKLYQNKNSADEDLGTLISVIFSIEIEYLHTAKVTQIQMMPGQWKYVHILFFFLSRAENVQINEQFEKVRQIVFDPNTDLFKTREMKNILKRKCGCIRQKWESMDFQYGFSLYM